VAEPLLFSSVDAGDAMANQQLEEFAEAFEKVKSRALVDPLFKILALKNPKEALRKVHDEPIPEDWTLVFIESGTTTHYPPETHVVMLGASANASEELSDDDLEDVAGGGDSTGTGLKGGW
jgi:hypothetical protein